MTLPSTLPPPPASLPLWPLPLLAGALPAVAALLALAISASAGIVPGCNPFIEGCTSISRAAREGLANHVFRALVLPAAALQAVVWLLAARWLAATGAGPMRALAVLGVLAPAALVLYGSFLGTEGAVYRLLRQYGTVLYFGGTCVAMLLTGRALERLALVRAVVLPAVLRHALVVLFGALVALGVVNALAGAVDDELLKDRLQNASEWWGSAVLTAVFVVLALVWRRLGLRLRVEAPEAGVRGISGRR